MIIITNCEVVCRMYRIVTCLLKIHKNVTDQLTSNTVSAQIFLALWTLANKQIALQSFKAIWRFQSSYSNYRVESGATLPLTRCMRTTKYRNVGKNSSTTCDKEIFIITVPTHFCLSAFLRVLYTHHTVTSNNHPFVEDMRCSTKRSLTFSACNDFLHLSRTVLNASTLPTCLLHYKECASHLCSVHFIWSFRLFGRTSK